MRRLLAVVLLLCAAPAFAIDEPQAPTGQQVSTKSTGDYLSDLVSESAPDRLYAARVLRGHLARALKTEAHAKEGSLALDEARAELVELEDRLPEACRGALRYDNVVSPCADILAMLDVKDALPELRARLATETRKGAKKRLEAAIAELGT